MRADDGPLNEVSMGSFRVEGIATLQSQFRIPGPWNAPDKNLGGLNNSGGFSAPRSIHDWILESPSIGTQQAPSAYAAKIYAHAG